VTLNCRLGPRSVHVTARMVIDASGRQTLLGRQLRVKQPDPFFKQYALHTWFEGLDRTALAPAPEKAGYIVVHFLPIKVPAAHGDQTGWNRFRVAGVEDARSLVPVRRVQQRPD